MLQEIIKTININILNLMCPFYNIEQEAQSGPVQAKTEQKPDTKQSKSGHLLCLPQCKVYTSAYCTACLVLVLLFPVLKNTRSVQFFSINIWTSLRSCRIYKSSFHLCHVMSCLLNYKVQSMKERFKKGFLFLLTGRQEYF